MEQHWGGSIPSAKCKKIPINGQHGVIGMSGNIALYQGSPLSTRIWWWGIQTEQRAPAMFSLRMYPRHWN
jgi:hypothetical protein